MTPTTLLLVVLTAAGLTMAYVSPDDQGRSKTVQRGAVETPRAHLRARPEPLSAHQYEQAIREPATELRVRRGEKVPRRSVEGVRRARAADVSSGGGAGSFAGSGSFSNSDGGSGGYQTSGAGGFPGFGFPAGGQYPYYPFHNPNPAGFVPMDFGAFFQYLQQMQNSIQQNAVNQGITNSYGIATRNGVFGPNGYGGVSSSSYSGNGIGFGGGFGGNAGGADGSNFIGYTQGGQGSGNGFEGASAVASIGSQGGYGSANLVPDIGSRFGSESGQFPASNGGNVGVFTGSSSGSSNINGQTKSFRTATAGHIDGNGKITSYTVRDPPQK